MKNFSHTTPYPKDLDATPKERKHIILLDGTWNDETGLGADMLITNIVRMSQIFESDEENQIVRYHRGLGNDNDNGFFSGIWKAATGKAITNIVDNAYANFVQDWRNGDRIYIFGFSRGAAAARLLADKIAKEGVPAEVSITLEPVENQETRVVEQKISKVKFDRSEKKSNIEIEFLGLWDTVSALGLTNSAKRFIGKKEEDLFTNNDIADNIQRAVHLVAMDETRKMFIPSLMNHKEGVTHEVWFPGSHSDVVGNYAENDLAEVSLYYMLKCLEEWNTQRGLKDFLINEAVRLSYTKKEIEKAHFHFHGRGLGEEIRTIKVQKDGKPTDMEPKIHQLYHNIASNNNSYSVFETKKLFRKAIKHFVNFQYMPFNVKMLNKKFETVG